ncbi:MAG: flagellar basal-body rod protein FlgF [Pseudomonadota bacterium]
MLDSVYVGTSGQIALETRLTTIAGNVANAGTVGFRATTVTFEELLNNKIKSGVSTVSSGEDTISQRPGTLENTGNSFDFAIQGDAWFGVEVNGEVLLTKDGRFALNSQAQLVTINGDPVIDPGGAPITLPGNATEFSVSGSGVISRNGEPISGIGLFRDAAPELMQRAGETAFRPNGQLEPIVDGDGATVLQGFVENSNVDPVREIVQLIAVQRAFEQNGAIMRETSDSLDRLIQNLSP